MRHLTEAQTGNLFTHFSNAAQLSEEQDHQLWSDIYAATSVEGVDGDVVFDYFTSDQHVVTEVYGSAEDHHRKKGDLAVLAGNLVLQNAAA